MGRCNWRNMPWPTWVIRRTLRRLGSRKMKRTKRKAEASGRRAGCSLPLQQGSRRQLRGGVLAIDGTGAVVALLCSKKREIIAREAYVHLMAQEPYSPSCAAE